MGPEKNSSVPENRKLSKKEIAAGVAFFMVNALAFSYAYNIDSKRGETKEEIRKVADCLRYKAVNEEEGDNTMEVTPHALLVDIDHSVAISTSRYEDDEDYGESSVSEERVLPSIIKSCGYNGLSNEQKIALFTALIDKNQLQECFDSNLAGALYLLMKNNVSEAEFRDYLKYKYIGCFTSVISHEDREMLWNFCKKDFLKVLIKEGYTLADVNKKLKSYGLTLKDIAVGAMMKITQPKLKKSL